MKPLERERVMSVVRGMGLASNLGISRKRAADFISRYFERYPKVHAFMEQAKKDGYEQIAAAFEETGNQEQEHAKRLFKARERGEVEITGRFPAGVI